jgi:hypothetical protein
MTMTKTTAAQVSLGAVVTPLSDVDTMAAAAVDRSLDFAAAQMNFAEPRFAVGHIQQGEPATCGYFQYALAREIADFLAAYDRDVIAVYSYDYDATPEDTVFETNPQQNLVHLIVRAHRKTSALKALIAAFDRAMAQAYGQRLSMPDVAYVLDAQVVDDAEAKAGSGYAGLISSINVRPSLVWER